MELFYNIHRQTLSCNCRMCRLLVKTAIGYCDQTASMISSSNLFCRKYECVGNHNLSNLIADQSVRSSQISTAVSHYSNWRNIYLALAVPLQKSEGALI